MMQSGYPIAMILYSCMQRTKIYGILTFFHAQVNNSRIIKTLTMTPEAYGVQVIYQPELTQLIVIILSQDQQESSFLPHQQEPGLFLKPALKN